MRRTRSLINSEEWILRNNFVTVYRRVRICCGNFPNNATDRLLFGDQLSVKYNSLETENYSIMSFSLYQV